MIVHQNTITVQNEPEVFYYRKIGNFCICRDKSINMEMIQYYDNFVYYDNLVLCKLLHKDYDNFLLDLLCPEESLFGK